MIHSTSRHRVGLCLWAATGLVSATGCPWQAEVGDSMLEPELIGAWKLISTTADGQTITSAGDEVLTLQSDGRYEDTIRATADDAGVWFAVDGLLMLDDWVTPDNPSAFTYIIEGSILTAHALGGATTLVYERQGEASTLSHAQIIAADSSLGIAYLTDVSLVGTWEYVSIEYEGMLVICPATSDIPGVACGEHEQMIFRADHSFEETASNPDHGTGVWYAAHGDLLFDDLLFDDHDPTAWTYSVHEDLLTMRTSDGRLTWTLRSPM